MRQDLLQASEQLQYDLMCYLDSKLELEDTTELYDDICDIVVDNLNKIK